MNRLSWLAGVALLAQVAACAAEDPLPQAPGIGGGGGTGGSERPIQEVDGLVGVTWDARPPAPSPDAPPAADGAPDIGVRDTAQPVDARTDDPLECSLLTQVCQGDNACYPFGQRGTKCLTPGFVPEGSMCTEDEECARGHICHDDLKLCHQLCELDLLCAVSGAPCTPLPGYRNVGYCPL